ncbi:hypothetical protein GCM10022255_069310 [Dactylosporangium darangshiense]|uniref:DUF4913 domain-containing protein n=1 Tax=Dactylosporangium darangshiense TaxID=579108 RepID=A0ABP8DHV5_9ACTN
MSTPPHQPDPVEATQPADPRGTPNDPTTIIGESGDALETIALLTDGLAELHDTVAALAEDHFRLRDEIRAAGGPANRSGAPADLRWHRLDRSTAATLWVWLIDWVGWLVARYELTEELPACWHQHPALVDELAALAAAWHGAYDPRAAGDAPLRWLEAFARTRARIRDWDEPTRCRNGDHHPRRIDLQWRPSWRDAALDTAEADGRSRPLPAFSPTPAGSQGADGTPSAGGDET